MSTSKVKSPTVPAGTPDTTNNPIGQKAAGHEDESSSEEWNVGTSDGPVATNDKKTSTTTATVIKIDDSEESTLDDDSSDSDSAAATSAAQQMSQPAGTWTSVLPNLHARRQDCIDAWKNMPYKKTVFATVLSIASLATSDYIFYSLATTPAPSREEIVLQVFCYALTGAIQLGSIGWGIEAYRSYKNRV